MITNYNDTDVKYLLGPVAIRDRANKIYELTKEGKGEFELHEEKFNDLVDFVLNVINDNYPDHNIPFHSRWGHFNVGKRDRVAILEEKLQGRSPVDVARAKLDLAIVSVLLDAGAGKEWKYHEKDSGDDFNRSEGLAVASFHMFMDGYFSKDPSDPYRVDGEVIKDMEEEVIVRGFQVNDKNHLVGVEGRTELMRNLGKALVSVKTIFKNSRPGNIMDYLLDTNGEEFKAERVLNAVLLGLGGIWPGRIALGDQNLGDVWSHPLLGEADSVDSLVPFHKLSQWLTYSLIEPMMDAGLKIDGVEELTGLAEYRNGGLLVDKGLIELKDKSKTEFAPNSKTVIEWRALTIVFLDRIGDAVIEKLGKTKAEFPLAKVLEGGTWWAGRRAAKEKREDGTPPLNIISDGTVF